MIYMNTGIQTLLPIIGTLPQKLPSYSVDPIDLCKPLLVFTVNCKTVSLSQSFLPLRVYGCEHGCLSLVISTTIKLQIRGIRRPTTIPEGILPRSVFFRSSGSRHIVVDGQVDTEHRNRPPTTVAERGP